MEKKSIREIISVIFKAVTLPMQTYQMPQAW